MRSSESLDNNTFGAGLVGLIGIVVIAAVLIGFSSPYRSSPPIAKTSPQPEPSQEKLPASEFVAAPHESDRAEDAPTPDAGNDHKAEVKPEPTATTGIPATAKTGQQLYAQHCAACHGERGDGKGLAAAFVFPKPRDFRASRFRLVSTDNNVPTEEDLHAVLLRGMPGSSMPPWPHLPEAERIKLVKEVIRLSREGAREQFVTMLKEEEGLTEEEIADDDDLQVEIKEFVDRKATPGESTTVPPIGEPTAAAIARGKEVYIKQTCHSCHGKEGKGDGAQKMLDAEGLPSSPRDFTRGIFKGGHDPASLYRRTAYGMPGTPMPGSKDMPPEEIVDLVHFIRSLSDESTRQSTILKRETITAQRVDAIPASAAGWTADAVGLRMTPLWWRNDADPGLQVQAVHDGKSVAVRMSWSDPSHDRHAARSESFEDAVAMELYRGDAEPFIGMGNSKAPVDVWFWDADRQGTPFAVEDVYPNTVVDVYPFSETVVVSAELNRDGARTADQPDVSLPARASGNQIMPTDGESGASSLRGGGPGTSTFRIPSSQLVEARGEWKDDRWTVVMTRPLTVEAEKGIALEPGAHASVAFAIWDGSQRDRDGKKLITIWQDLELED